MTHGMLRLIFFNDTATTEIYTLSLHDALPISAPRRPPRWPGSAPRTGRRVGWAAPGARACRERTRPASGRGRSEEHTSELQSRQYLVCRVLLEKKTKNRLGHNLTHSRASPGLT